MSADPTINAALLNMCAQVQGSGSNAVPAGTRTEVAQPSSALAAVPTAATTSVCHGNNTSGGAPAATPTPARPASDYVWLRNALASVEAPEKRLKQLLFSMEDKTADGNDGPVDPEERLEALEELSDMVEDVNWAAEFNLMEGPQRVLRVLRRERVVHPLTTTPDPLVSKEGGGDGSCGAVTFASIPLYTQLAMIVAHASQLNEPVQAVFQAAHWEQVLLHLLCDTVKAMQAVWCDATETERTEKAAATSTKLMKLLAALLYACSCLCREHPPNTIQFLQHGGLAVLSKVLTLTLTIVSTVPAASAGEVAGCVTTLNGGIAQGADVEGSAMEGGTDRTDYAYFLRSANTVTTRAFFFAAYLASTGVSSEAVIELICQNAEKNEDEAVQKAAARGLLELVAKSPKATKEAVHTHMPKRFYEWKKQLQRTASDAQEGGKDERQCFVEALDSSN
ncbi:hypothetical protein ABL78_3767 [Leptomonas seymouri]|uniref:Uncharacterized protein n=1 Tax=Leptomonas seymouri TaxID=5684 RepID=A0A0N1HXH6_LEPSE|nr:hypothetical protein ABL78_3767 [Leptomonas seymouri]|eukprot:KPI87165.1 hypothetical protein ABL78_3767 [Leptomonas seymouri]